MQITCKCLNVIIESNGNKFEHIDKALKNILGSDEFFKEDISTLDLPSITKKLPNLEEVHNSGSWVIHRCLNCRLFTYAYNKDTGLNTIIVSNSLLTDAREIAALKQSPLFSPVFNVLINEEDVKSNWSDNLQEDQGLLLVLEGWMYKQTILTEEKIQALVEKEYSDLEKRKERARRDHLILSRLVSTNNKSTPKVTKKETDTPSPKKSPPVNKRTPNISKLPKGPSNNGSSFDSEGLFYLDDIENSVNEGKDGLASSDGGSDSEEEPQMKRHDETVEFARSLPVPVPQFMQDRRHNDFHNEHSPEVPTDIAASIKALAKSVHGDAIFGELPPPRLSTHL